MEKPLINTDKFTYNSGELIIGEKLCDACYYRNENNEKICKKYPNGKPEKILVDKDCWCEYFSVIDMGDDFVNTTKPNNTVANSKDNTTGDDDLDSIISSIEETLDELEKNQ